MPMKNFVRSVLFFLLTAVMIIYLANELQMHGLSDSSENSFFHQTPNSMDILYIGNCHAYSSVKPTQIEEQTGLHGYMLGAGNMDAELLYYYTKAALERQKPKYLVIEVFAYAVNQSYVSKETIETSRRENIADLPFPYRAEIIKEELKREDEHWVYDLLKIGFFHENWTEPEFFGKENVSEDSGWVSFGTDSIHYPDRILQQDYQNDEMVMSDSDYSWFVRTIDLCREKNVYVILFAAPYYITDYETGIFNQIEEYALSNDIPFLNLTKNDMLESVSFYRKYMVDSRHVNKSGAEKVSEILGDFIFSSIECRRSNLNE